MTRSDNRRLVRVLVSSFQTLTLVASLALPFWFSLRVSSGRTRCWILNDGVWVRNLRVTDGEECEAFVKRKANYTSSGGLTTEFGIVSPMALVWAVLAVGCSLSSLAATAWELDRLPTRTKMAFMQTCLSVAFLVAYLPAAHAKSSEAWSLLSPGVPFSGVSSCSFITPFASISTLFESSSLRCAILGPSFLIFLAHLFLIVVGVMDDFFAEESTRRESEELDEEELRTHTLVSSVMLIMSAACNAGYLYVGVEVLAQLTVRMARDDELALFRDTLNLFNFSPLTSTSFFWDANAKIVSLVALFSIALLPVVKYWIWILIASTRSSTMLLPSRVEIVKEEENGSFSWWKGMVKRHEQTIRDALLYLCDLSGKFQLANLYALTLVGAAMAFQLRAEMIPPKYLSVTAATAISVSDFGANLYAFSAMLNIVLGQWFLTTARPRLNTMKRVGETRYDEEEEEEEDGSFTTMTFPTDDYTPRGKIVLAVLLLTNVAVLIWIQDLAFFTIHVRGVMGLVLGEENKEYSLNTLRGELLTKIPFRFNNESSERGSYYPLQLLVVVTTLLAPIVRSLVGACSLFFARRDASSIKTWLRVMNFLSRWNALDIFLLTVNFMLREMKNSTSHLIGDAVPRFSHVVSALPLGLGDMYAEMGVDDLAPFIFIHVWVLVVDKTLAHLVNERMVDILTSTSDVSVARVVDNPFLYWSTLLMMSRHDSEERRVRFGWPRSVWDGLRGFRGKS